MDKTCAKYKKIEKSAFLERVNRFVAKVLIDGRVETVHVKNTGRCKELLIPGVTAYLCPSDNGERKTKYDLVAVRKKDSNKVVNIDSQIPNAVAAEWVCRSGLFSKNAKLRREVTFGNSRFDLYLEDGNRRAFIEVKGVTLEENGIALFPDAPTERGTKHLFELVRAKKAGYEAYVIFVIQMDGITAFTPNVNTDIRFAKALISAKENGVEIIAIDCNVSPDDITAKDTIPIIL